MFINTVKKEISLIKKTVRGYKAIRVHLAIKVNRAIRMHLRLIKLNRMQMK